MVSVAEAFIGKPPGDPDLLVLRIGLHGFVEVDRGFLRLVQREITDRAREQRPGLLRLKTVRRREVVDRELVLLLALVKQAAAE